MSRPERLHGPAVPWDAAPLLLPVLPRAVRAVAAGPATAASWASAGRRWAGSSPADAVLTSDVEAALACGADAVLLDGVDPGGRLAAAGFSCRTWTAVRAAGGAVALVSTDGLGLGPPPRTGWRARTADAVRELLGPQRVTVASRRPGPPALLDHVPGDACYVLAGGGSARRRAVLVAGDGRTGALAAVVKTGEADRGRREQEVLAVLQERGVGRVAPRPLGTGTEAGLSWSAETAVAGRPLVDLLARRRSARQVEQLLDEVADWLARLGAATRTPRRWSASDDAGLPLAGEHAQLAAQRDELVGVPGVLVHGDLATGVNLLVDRASWAVVDWETARHDALPLTDLLPLLCGTLARLKADAGAAGTCVLRLCAGLEPESPWLLGRVRHHLAATGTPEAAAGRLAALAVGYQASMRLEHDRLLEQAGEPVVPWQTPWDEVARSWSSFPGLGRDWPALTGARR